MTGHEQITETSQAMEGKEIKQEWESRGVAADGWAAGEEGRAELEGWRGFVEAAADTMEWHNAEVLFWDRDQRRGKVLLARTHDLCPGAPKGQRTRLCGLWVPNQAFPLADHLGVPASLDPKASVHIRLARDKSGHPSIWRIRPGSVGCGAAAAGHAAGGDATGGDAAGSDAAEASADVDTRFPYETAIPQWVGEPEVVVGTGLPGEYWAAVAAARPSWIPLAATKSLLEVVGELAKKGQGVSFHANERANERAEYPELNLRSTLASHAHHRLYESGGDVIVVGTQFQVVVTRDLRVVKTVINTPVTYARWKDAIKEKKAKLQQKVDWSGPSKPKGAKGGKPTAKKGGKGRSDSPGAASKGKGRSDSPGAVTKGKGRSDSPGAVTKGKGRSDSPGAASKGGKDKHGGKDGKGGGGGKSPKSHKK
jgi:hypothetical protein